MQPGFTYGETDPIGYRAVVDPVSLHHYHATLLHLPRLQPVLPDPHELIPKARSVVMLESVP